MEKYIKLKSHLLGVTDKFNKQKRWWRTSTLARETRLCVRSEDLTARDYRNFLCPHSWRSFETSAFQIFNKQRVTNAR